MSSQLVSLANGKYINPNASEYENTMMDIRRELELAVSAFTCLYYAPCPQVIALSKLPKDATTPVSTDMRSVELAHGLCSSRENVLQAYGCDEKNLGANLVIQGTSILSGQCESQRWEARFQRDCTALRNLQFVGTGGYVPGVAPVKSFIRVSGGTEEDAGRFGLEANRQQRIKALSDAYVLFQF